MQVKCPGCQKRLNVPEKALGKKIACPRCKTIMGTAPVVERPPSPAAPSPITVKVPPPNAAPAPARPSSGKWRIVLGLIAVCIAFTGGIGVTWMILGNRDNNSLVNNDGKKPKEPEDEIPDDPDLKDRIVPVKITPPTLDAVKVVRGIPGAIDDVAVGGGGRFILLHIPTLRKIALFDVNEAKIVHFFPVRSETVRFAAGMDKLVMVFPESRTVQRWSLLTREREHAETIPGEQELSSVVLGSASQGPIAIAGSDRVKAHHVFLDLQTLKPIGVKLADGHNGFGGNLRVSADGTVFGMWSSSTSPSGLQSYTLVGKELRGRYQHSGVGHVVPGPDGNILYTHNGLYGNDTRPLVRDQQDEKNDGAGRFCLPAQHGNYYLSIAFNQPSAKKDEPASPAISIHMADKVRPIMTLRSIDLGLPPDPTIRAEGPDLDKRFLLIPEAKVFIVLPHVNEEVWVYRFDLEEALEKAGIDYLFVAGRPSANATKGKTFTYSLGVKSKQGGVKFRLESGPPGMRMSAKGRLTWNVPMNFADGAEEVMVVITDQSGQEVVHTFKITVGEPIARIRRGVRYSEPLG